MKLHANHLSFDGIFFLFLSNNLQIKYVIIGRDQRLDKTLITEINQQK